MVPARLRKNMRTKQFFVTLALIVMTAITSIADDKSAKVDKLFADFNQSNSPGASVMVIRDGKILFAKGYGMANTEKKIRCDTNTNFRLASVSKQFTAMAVMILAERKTLSLDERLTDFFPEFPAYGKQITVRHLLTHTSGLLDYEDLIPPGTTLPVLDQDVLRLMLQQDKTDFQPGSQYRYSNTGFALLAMIVEARSGQTFATFLRENIFTPLGMNNTLAYEQGISTVRIRAMGHTLGTNGVEQTDQSITSAVLGDGGIYSSVNDLVKWDRALYSTKLVSEKTRAEIFTPHSTTDKPDTSYGYGWYIGNYHGLKKVWHSGETCGFTTRIERIPKKRFCVIVLTNRRNAREQLAEIVQDLIGIYLSYN
jgi:CubicO group peptidase (beta-lactamase class C family)